jgi:ATP-binding cassette subfamily B protein
MNETARQNMSPKEKSMLILSCLKGMKRFFLVAVICALLSLGSTALIPQVIRFTVDSLLGEKSTDFKVMHFLSLSSDHTGARGLYLAFSIMLVLALLSGFFSFGQRFFLAKGSESFVKRMRDCLFSHIQRLPFSWHMENQTGDIIQRCTSDVDVIRSFVCVQMMDVIRTIILIVLDLSIMFSMHVGLSVIAVLFIPLVTAASLIFFQKIASRFQKADEAEGELTSAVQENLIGVRVVRAFGREQFEIQRFDEKNDAFTELWIRLGKLLSIFWATGDLLTSLQVLTIVAVGTCETVNGSLTLGGFIAFVSYSATLAWPVRSLGRVLAEMSKAGVSIERVGYILNSPEEADAEGVLTAPIRGDLVFHHVSFGYEKTEVLRDVSFTIPEGKTFAILGGTGSGKSTLVHLLDRLYDLSPEQGSITIGGINVNDFDRRHLRRSIGLVLQEPFLFSRTIRENITMTKPTATEDELHRAAEIACVDEALSELRHGYDTVVGERGVTLSGGQKQRVAIARMLVQNAPIMIFDDSLSAVDTETDAKIRAALKSKMKDATVILISHRITTLMQADCIMVLENGRVTEIGTHGELMERPGIYRDIYEIQMSSDDRVLVEGGKADGGI